MRKPVKLFILIIAAAVISSCSNENLALFQDNKPEKELRLFEVLDETPALKSLFDEVDPQTFNVLMDRLVREDPQIMVRLMKKTASTFYGDPESVVFPLAVRDLSGSFISFYNAYTRDKEKFDSSYDVFKNILSLDPQVMKEGTATISNALTLVKNIQNASKVIPGVQNVDSTLEKIPVVNGSFELWADNTLVAKDNGYGIISGTSGAIVSGEINYLTGHFVCTLESAPSQIEARYAASGDAKWNLFSEGQELGDLGYSGITSLIDYADILNDFYGRNPDFDNPSALIESFLQSVKSSPLGVEAKINDIVTVLADPDFAVQEKNLADWMIADKDKVAVTTYALKYFYPLVLDPVLANASVPADFDTMRKPSYIQTEDEYKNFIRRGRWIVDDAAYIYTASPRKLTGNAEESDTMLLKSFTWALSKDIELYDDLERVPIFDFQNNAMLSWANGIVDNNLNPAVKALPKSRWKEVLWSGWRYTSTSGGYTDFKGLFKVANNNPAVIDVNDGYVTRMAKTRSTDANEKYFRRQVNDILNGNNDGVYNDPNDIFKSINFSYSHDNPATTGINESESMVEAIMTNLQLYLLSHYYSPADRKWALTPADGSAFFAGDTNRNLQSLYGNMSTSMRNLVSLDENGKKPTDVGGQTIPMASELLYVLAAGYGITDPANAPGELSLANCLKSMGSPLASSDSITADFGIEIKALGNDRIYRKSYSGGNYESFTTQRTMPAMELLQPGTFRRRQGGQAYEWRGSFSGSQGDIRGIVNASDQIVTSNWTLTEIALSCWEGYGPYTFKGRAPNGSDCKYKNDWYSDWYYIDGEWNGNKGPGFAKNGFSEGRYHTYEKIFRPESGTTGFAASNYANSQNVPMPKYGYTRDNKSDGSYVNITFDDNHKVTLDCDTREEAIRKNYYWLMNQKKYQFMIPIHAYKRVGFWPFNADIEIYAYTTINANGVVGVTKAKRYDSSLANNARWGIANNINSGYYQRYEDADNYFVNTITTGETSNTSRFAGVSFNDTDYMMALDYKYYVSGLFAGLATAMVDMSAQIWGCLGDNSVLPSSVGENFTSVANLGNITYSSTDLITSGYTNTSADVLKFKKFYNEYYSDAGLFNPNGTLAVKASELPPVPRVKDVSYPDSYNSETGAVTSWKTHTGDSKGKFEDILGIFACAVGTMHADGKIYADIAGNTVASYDQINTGNFAFYAKDGFRANIDNLILLVAALNEHKKGSGNGPVYNASSWLNIMIDHNGTSVVPGSRAGVLPKLLSSKYLNINNPGPIKTGVEDGIKHTIRTYFNYFDLTRGYDGPKPGDPGAPLPSSWADLPEYYKLVGGQKVDEDGDGYSDINPALDWNVPINRFRYITSDRSIDQVERILDYIRDLSYDSGAENRPAFREFVKQTVIAFNIYMRVRYLDEHPGEDPSAAFALNMTESDIDSFISFVQNTDYKKVFDFIREKRLNDIEKYYNFKLDDWVEAFSPAEMKDVVDELNVNLVKFFGINFKEGYIDGIYKLKSGASLAKLDAVWPGAFKAGETVYGYGKYISISSDKNEDGLINESDWRHSGSKIVIDGEGDNRKYYEYLDIETVIKEDILLAETDLTRIFEISFEGANAFFEFKRLGETVFTPYCTQYTDPWYRAGNEPCPNIFNPHNYDPRMDWAMNKYNKFLIEELTESVFSYDQTNESYAMGKTGSKTYSRPVTLIDWLYGKGSPDSELSLEHELNFAKDFAIDKIFDETEMTLPNPDGDGDLTGSPRSLAGIYRNFIKNNFTEYEYTRGGSVLKESYKADYAADAEDGHFHAVNNILEIASEFLDPKSSNYVTGALYTFWENFLSEANNAGISSGKMISVRDSAGTLLFDKTIFYDVNQNGIWDDQESFVDLNLNGRYDAGEDFTDTNNDGIWTAAEPAGERFTDANSNGIWDEGEEFQDLNANGIRDDGYTRFFSKLTARAPKLMEAFDGSYEDMVDVAIMAFEPGGLGEYMLDSMQGGNQYELYDFVTEFNTLLNQDIFKNYQGSSTFWWQMGSLMDSLSYMIEHQPGYPTLDYYDNVKSVFR